MDKSKGEQRKYDFIFEGEKKEDSPEKVVHEEKFRFDGKVEDTGLSDMVLEDLGGNMKEEEEKKPELNDELKEIAEKTPDEPVKKDTIISEPTPEELEAQNNGLEEKIVKMANEVKNVVERKDVVKTEPKTRNNWVYLLVAGLMGMAIGACVVVALVYGGVIGGKVRVETVEKTIVQECECEECKECECEKKEELEDNCSPDMNGNTTNCLNEEENVVDKDNTTKKDKTNKTE